jgi:FG-GAP-like repeat/Bacterial Ig-like domain (group 3)
MLDAGHFFYHSPPPESREIANELAHGLISSIRVCGKCAGRQYKTSLTQPKTQMLNAMFSSPGSPPSPLFVPAVTYDTGAGSAYSIVSADVNHDGKVDLIVAAGTSVAVLLGKGDGTFQTAVNYDSGGLYPMAVVADVNGDGKLDILMAIEFADGSNNVGVLLGNGDGTFQPLVTYSSGAFGPNSIAVADLNSDGRPDLVLANCSLTSVFGECGGGGGVVSVLLGNGDGTFQTAATYSSGGYEVQEATSFTVAIADINGDGKPDLIVANSCGQPCQFYGEGSVGILEGNGDGTFQPVVTYDSGAYNAHSVEAVDLSGDGKPDLVVGGCMPGDGVCGVVQDGVVSVFLADGHGSFQPPLTFDSGGVDAVAVAIADLNGDGKLDLAVTNYNSPVEVLLGNGDGTFQSSLGYEGSGRAVAIADLNGDGQPDLVTSDGCVSGDCSKGDGQIAVLLHVGGIGTTTTLTSTPNPSVYGQATFTAEVRSGSGTPTGTVTLFEGLYFLGSGSLVGGRVTIPGAASAGSDAITAQYQGSVKYQPSLSSVLNQVVTQATTTTTVTPTGNPWPVNKKIVYAVNVTSQYGGPVSGSVTCLDNGSGLAGVRGQRWQFQNKYTNVETRSIVCTYTGDNNNLGSTAPTLIERVVYPTITVVTTSGSPSHVGKTVTFTATVTSKYGNIPNGDLVTFSTGINTLCSVPLSAGSAMCTTSFSKAKTYNVKAQFAGDTTFGESLGKVVQVVEQ